MDDSHPIINSIKQMGVDMVDQIQEDAVAHVNEEVFAALDFERKMERKRVACVFAELDIDRRKAVDLLVNEWDTDPREADDLVLQARRVFWSVERLSRYLREQDWTQGEISGFLRAHEVAEQLRANRSLSAMTPAVLFARLDGKAE